MPNGRTDNRRDVHDIPCADRVMTSVDFTKIAIIFCVATNATPLIINNAQFVEIDWAIADKSMGDINTDFV